MKYAGRKYLVLILAVVAITILVLFFGGPLLKDVYQRTGTSNEGGSGSSTADKGGQLGPTSVGFIPLIDLGNEKYKGYEGGLYENGLNTPPQDYLDIGFEKVGEIQPLDSSGEPSSNGKIVLLSIGLSHTTQEYSTFVENVKSRTDLNPALVLVDGAEGAHTADAVSGNPIDPRKEVQFDEYWDEFVPTRISEAGATDKQVQAVWLKTAIARPGEYSATKNFPDDATALEGYMKDIVEILKDNFPNLKAVYVSSRSYAGCAKTDLNPEPYAYQSGFAVKWLVQDYVDEFRKNPDSNSPYVAWGPYFWADGTNSRSDGLTYDCSDYRESDGTHPSAQGRQKIGNEIVDFFTSDQTTTSWFLK